MPKTNRSNNRSIRTSRIDGETPPPQRPRRKKRKLKLIPVIITTLIVILLAVGIGLSAWVLSLASDLPEITPQSFTPRQASLIYDDGENHFASLHAGENRVSVPLADIPQHLQDAVVATEDIRFYNHFGVDIRRVFGAVKADLLSGSFSQGASTITMQLARNAILETQAKKWGRKVVESILAIKIEKEYSKAEILYYYLNEVHFGHGTYGVQAACTLYFDKPVQEITLSEAAMLAGILRSPAIYSPYNDLEAATNIRNVVLDNMVRYKPEYAQEAALVKEEPLVVSEDNRQSEELPYDHPWFTDYVISQAEDILGGLGMDEMLIYTGGLSIYTTVDTKTQTRMEQLFADSSNFPDSSTSDDVESAMAVMDPHTGEIKGLVGGRNYATRRGYNRATGLSRQPGSIIKPVVAYGPAIEAGYSPATVQSDCPTTFGTNYSPGNYDGTWRGVISMREAIKYSVNIPAVKTLQMIGTKTGLNFALKLGLPLSETDDNNLALALGGTTKGVSPLDMAGAYSAFDNGGIYIQPYCITKIIDNTGKVIYEAQPYREQVMSEQTAYLITDMLTSVTQSGTGTNARMNRPVASKTGTTELPNKPEFKNKKGNKDAWFAAYTPELVGVIWMGYDKDVDSDGKPQYMRQIYGGKYPALLWKAVMTTALENVEVKQFNRPSGIVSLSIDSKSGLLPSELTPAEYIKPELFNNKHLPEEISDVWQMVEIDADNNTLANQFCPNRVSKALLKIPESVAAQSSQYRSSADGSLYVPAATCTEHTTYAEGYFPTDDNPPDYGEDDYPGGGDFNYGDYPGYSLDTPKNLSVFVNTDDGIAAELSWSDDNDPSVTLYVIERIENGDADTRLKFSTWGKSYRDTTVSLESAYRYRVYAYHEELGTSGWSNAVTIAPGE